MNCEDFQNLGEGVIRSSKGFQIQCANLKLVYKERDRKMIFEMEPGIRQWFIFLQHMKWEPPHGHEVVSDEDQERITQNIADALDFGKTAFCLETTKGNVYNSTYKVAHPQSPLLPE